MPRFRFASLVCSVNFTLAYAEEWVTEPAEGAPHLTYQVADQTFYRYVDRLKRLYDFLYREAVPISVDGSNDFRISQFQMLRFDPKGRSPTSDEWDTVANQTQALLSMLTPALRRKFLMSGSSYFLSIAAMCALLSAAVLLTFGLIVGSGKDWPNYLLIVIYSAWLIATGILGYFSSIGMNILAIQSDVEFDITSTRLVLLRASLGALFAVVLTLPFGYSDFAQFCVALNVSGAPSPPQPAFVTGAPERFLPISFEKQSVMLLVTFVLGFSTSFLLLVLNQFMEALKVFLGKKP